MTIPSGMMAVTKVDFYARLFAEKRNIHPRPERLETDWMIVGTRTRWGWHSRGWAGPFDQPEVYALER